MSARIYHERQVAQLCALHALNNLYQRRNLFSKQQLDDYCYALTPRVWLNPHRSWLGWGNYDINVIMYAVQQLNCETIWFDRRRDPHCLNLAGIFGFILNIGVAVRFAYYIELPGVRSRHWVALRRIDGNYYNLDSKLAQPRCIGSAHKFLDYLRQQLRPENDHELFVIVARQRAEQQCWLMPEYRLMQESE
ncbi:josephin-like protein [Drosophila novamexicana]|uniref:josephin-like protein n=1 Tax=Drosophila novamexicana TaxID=47314 RepID=UPI0011E60584|nr:josephin-like protein [Drosophila novamexicana]